MHTSCQLDVSHFDVKIEGVPGTREQVFPEWSVNDRLGIIVDEPFGALGASLLLQLAITAFYDVRPARRREPLYPDNYLFHVGGRYGSHMSFDIFPSRKEIFLGDEPAEILEAINERAITRLVVVDGRPGRARHHFKEPASARDRIVSAYAYSPGGRVADGDVEIAALSSRVTHNTKLALNPERTYQVSTRNMPNNEILLPETDRSGEVDAELRKRIAAQRTKISTDGLPRETYRRVSINEAIHMLNRHAEA